MLCLNVLCSAIQQTDLSPLMSPLPLSPTISISVSNFVISRVDSLDNFVYALKKKEKNTTTDGGSTARSSRTTSFLSRIHPSNPPTYSF